MKTPPAYGPYISTRRPRSRRHFLRGAGVALSLPFLDAMLPTFARAQASSSPLAPGAKPRRMLAIINNLGFLGSNFSPSGEGSDYKLSPYLELIKDHRQDFTVLSGVSLPNVYGGHPTEVAWLTGAPSPASSSFRNTISLDQVVAGKIGTLTRFPSLSLAVNIRDRSLSVSGTGVTIPPEDRAANVFKQLFVQGTAAEVETQIRQLNTRRSILDTVSGHVKDLEKNLGTPDRERIDQYFTSVRSLESRLQASQEWEKKPKPAVTAPVPVDPANPAQYFEKLKIMYDLAVLALQTDSTRAITLFSACANTPAVAGNFDLAITEAYHGLSHHGRSPDKMAQLRVLDVENFKLFNKLLAGIKAVNENGESLLERTMVLYGSNLGDGNAHLTDNLPTILAGGGFKHGRHLVFDSARNYPLTNLHLTMLHRLGIEADKFSSSTGTFRGLEMS